MKKALSLLLVFCLTAGLLAGCAKKDEPAKEEPASSTQTPAATETPAEEPQPDPTPAPAGEPVSYAESGIDIPAAASDPDTKGGTLWQSYGILSYDPNVSLLELLYFAIPKEEFTELYQKYKDDTITEDEQSRFLSSYSAAGYVVGSTGSLEEAAADLFDGPYDEQELGKADGYTFWFVTFPEDDAAYLADLDAEYAEDFRKLQADLKTTLAQSKFYAPEDPMSALAGQVVHFETTDLDGNTVTSEELFAQNEITMINYWATWCGPCKGELAELGELHERLRAKGCGIIGIVSDGADDAETTALAKQLLADNGVGYPNIVPSDEMHFLDDVGSIPTSFFVGRDGSILAMPIVGAQVEAYEPKIDALLAGTDTEAASTPAAGTSDVYRIIVKDENGNAVEGVKVQFCSETDCRFADTDADGVAVFDGEPGVYTVHILKAPDGYAKDETEYQTAETYGDLVITLKKG